VQATVPEERERLFDCDAFRLWRLHGESPFTVGAEGVPRVLVCTGGTGEIEHAGETYTVRKGEVWLLPAVVGVCTLRPSGSVALLEIAIPDKYESGQASKSSEMESE
jgi:mannose-6-phosphate isomerase